MLIEVDTAADAKGKPAPSSIKHTPRMVRNIDVANVIDQWSGVDDRYFKIERRRRHIIFLHPTMSRVLRGYS